MDAPPPLAPRAPVGAMAAAGPLSEECQRLISVLRQQCPGVLVSVPLPPGTAAPAPVPVDARAAQGLVSTAALAACGLMLESGATGGDSVVWTRGDHELLVIVAKVQLQLGQGVIAVTIPVRCDQAGDAEVHVSFVVGDAERSAGLFAATEDRPRGPDAVVDLWGDALTAFAWQLVLDVAAGIAAHAGADADGAGLVPAALTATPDGLAILPQARHHFDRLVRL
jgi:hypothetical protein